MLRNIVLENCEGLKSLPDGMMLKMRNDSTDSNNLCLLEKLVIFSCPSLICFPKGQLPTTLDQLVTYRCPSLKSLPEGIPATLKKLYIRNCERLESLPEGIMHQHSTNAAALKELEISVCPSLTPFPRGKFPSTLERLHIEDCEHLESISGEMFHSTNNSLQSLILMRYPNLKTLPDCLNTLTYLRIEDFENLELLLPQIKKLTRLTRLDICNCKNIKTPLSQWGLSRLTSLKYLHISGMFPDATSFSDDPHSILFPTTLTSLTLSEFQNLESLASLSLQTLTSLEKLWIRNCPKLRSILSREGLLPDTLSELNVHRCPHLTQRYSKEEGDDWPKIAHIPCVHMYG
ncbi:putative disease resistance protein At3g14460 [Vitis riparia]|uniref:putative disease resistance protein At3g14460 n=1 Tax=Vitis riparia TaxID=96939 RepID=UPI00155AE6D9|nr:putative disease resistance protein At3g14460 [Vitis riparia]